MFALVFEGDVAPVVGLAEDGEDAGDVDWLLFAVLDDLGLELAVNGLGGEPGDLGVAVVLEVARVEVDAEPRGWDSLDDPEHGVGGLGPLAVVAGLYLLSAFAAQVIPTAAVAILIAPLAITTATDLGMSPYALMMTVSLSASASFMSPVAHPANVLVMGPGGYRFIDYVKVGLPLTLVCLVVTLLLLPLVWPLVP